MNWFLENDRMNSIRKGNIFNFGLRPNGFIFPLFKRLRLDTFENDFGVSAYLIETNKSFDYMVINEDNHLMEITERIYNYCYARHFGVD